jgi:multidrug efflux pump subunit AcrB
MSGRIAAYFQRHALTPLIALILLLLGLFAVGVTPREEEPQIDVTMANVMVPFPGAAAEDVEALVARPVEQALARLSGVEHIYSVSRPGMALITVQFKVGVKSNDALVRLYDTVHSKRDRLLPQLGVEDAIVKPKGIDDVPIVSLTLWHPDGGAAFDLQQIAHAAETELKRIPGTRDVTVIGGPGHVIRVALDPERMSAHGISVQDVRAALQLSHVSQPAGSLISANQAVEVTTGQWIESADDVRQRVVGVHEDTQGGGRTPVFLADVAEVIDGPGQPSHYVWHGRKAKNGDSNGVEEHAAVTLSITKQPGVNAADVAAAVIQRANQLKGSLIPEGVEFTVTRNYGQTATEKAEQLIGKLIFATAFVVLLVLVALGRREALIVGLAVTLTLAATLFASWAWGFTLNRVSLFALIFSIGILVDDAIVVVENIHRHQQLEPGTPLWRIIPAAVEEVGGPTILATFTVIAALLPMAFVSGLMGPYMSPIPINASLGMFISLAIAFVVTPWLALKLMKTHDPAHADSHISPGSGRIERIFRRILPPFLDARHGRRARRLLWLAILGAIVIAISLAAFKLVVLKMLPFDNKSEFQVVLDMPVGTPVEETSRVLREIGAYLVTVEEVRDYQAYAGTASPINFNGLVRQYDLRNAAEMGDLQVNLKDKSRRQRSSHAIGQALQSEIAAIAARHGGNAKLVEVPPGPPVLSPIVAEIYGPDYTGQIAVAKKVRAAFETTPDIVGVDDSSSSQAAKLELRIQHTRAALAGVTPQDIVNSVRVALGGEDLTPLHGQHAQYAIPVHLGLPDEQKDSVDNLLRLQVRARDNTLLPLADLVEVRPAQREQAIHHKDLLPVVYVTGDMGGPLDSPLYGMFEIRNRLKELSLEDIPGGGTLGEYFIRQPADPYAGYSLKWDGEWQITYETFRDMGLAYAVGLILIYLLVVAQFKSYLAPLIIMAPIPLTIIGVLPGHALAGSQFTATSMIGMIALAGIIVRNSILLVDFINQQVAAGQDFAEAVVQSAIVRAQPIALTAAAAMLGALFILDDPIFNGLALALIFGILVSTVLTLVVIPVLYFAAMQHRIEQRSPPVSSTHPSSQETSP